jgi:hypothetical protein
MMVVVDLGRPVCEWCVQATRRWRWCPPERSDRGVCFAGVCRLGNGEGCVIRGVHAFDSNIPGRLFIIVRHHCIDSHPARLFTVGFREHDTNLGVEEGRWCGKYSYQCDRQAVVYGEVLSV